QQQQQGGVDDKRRPFCPQHGCFWEHCRSRPPALPRKHHRLLGKHVADGADTLSRRNERRRVVVSAELSVVLYHHHGCLHVPCTLVGAFTCEKRAMCASLSLFRG
ncbi:unnamed protein product, partial [Ectocarpus fasciculatus]